MAPATTARQFGWKTLSTAVLVASLSAPMAACGTFSGSDSDSGTVSASSAKPSQIDPQLKMAALQAEAQHNYLEAAQHYQSLLSRDPENLELAIALVRNLRFAGSTPQDIDILNRLIAKHGRTPQLLAELGKSYVASDRMNLAVPVLQECAAMPGATWDAFSALGVAYDYQGDFANARQAYTQALMLSPRNPEILNNLALSQAQSGDLTGAIETLGQAVDQPSASAQVRQNLALMLALHGDPSGAERLARKDLPKDMAEQNASYYQYLTSGN